MPRLERGRRWLAAFLMIAAIHTASGCASILHLPTLEPYAGVRADAAVLAGGDLGVLPLIDLPLSLAVDTALLPVTIPCKVAGASSGVPAESDASYGGTRAFD